jgi:hypothetical protein
MPAQLEVFDASSWPSPDGWCDARLAWLAAHGASLDELNAEVEATAAMFPAEPDPRLPRSLADRRGMNGS